MEITNHQTGEVVEITRDVCTQHPAWVLEQMGVENEIQLQQALDQLYVENWYDGDEYLGPDNNGLSMRFLRRYYYWVAAGEDDNTSTGDTGYIGGDLTAQEAAEQYAEELRAIKDCKGEVVRTRCCEDTGDTGEAIV